MEGKRTAPAGIAPILSSFRRLCRGSSPLCCGALAFSLVHVAVPAEPPVAAPEQVAAERYIPSKPPPPLPLLSHGERREKEEAYGSLSFSPLSLWERGAGGARASEGMPPDTLETAPESEVSRAATPVDNLEHIQRAADLLVEVNSAFGVPRAPYGQLIYEIALRHSINPHLVAAVIHVESAFNPRAVSRKGAYGLMQLLPATARRFGVKKKRDLFDPVKNMEAGVRYLEWLTQRFGGDVEKILAAYNAGEGAVDRYGGIPPYRETQRYVEKVFGLLNFKADRPAEQAVASGGIVAAGK